MKKENTEKFSYSGYTLEENKEIDRKINSWSKKELVDVIYELAEKIDEGEPEKKITQALEDFDNAVRTMRLWNEKNLSAGKCLEQWNGYRKNLLFVLHENVISTANLLLRIPETIGKRRVSALSRVYIQIS